MNVWRVCLPLIVGICAASNPAFAGDGAFAHAMTSGETHASFRYRYERVNQDSFDEDAHASTLRLRLSYRTGKWLMWSGFVELDHVAEIIGDNFNSGAGTAPERSQYPVVADPRGTDLNQVYVQVNPGNAWQLRLGRQRILLDNQRFVGGVGWRQNEQTYDAVSSSYQGPANAKLFYAFVGNTNRIFGNEVPSGDHRQATHLLHAEVMLSKRWKLGGYAYLIDNDDAPAFSTRTFGARVAGGLPAGNNKLALTGELATQSDTGNGPLAFDALYFRIDGKLSFSSNWLLGIGYEVLEGDTNNAGRAFRTPLATLHAFNGWADKFLTTPDQGLTDFFVSGSFKLAPWTADLIYHDFSAESGGDDFGNEIDLSVSRSFGKHYKLIGKLASFRTDSATYENTTKLWLMFTADF